MPTPVPAGAVRHTGGCLQPVLLRGRADYIDGGTGELIHRYTTVHEPGGVLPIACKTRRASRCPPCAEVYRADTYQLIRAGLTGGKGIPATVADHPVRVRHADRAVVRPGPRPPGEGRPGPGLPTRAGRARPARTASACPAARSTPGTTTGSASRCARTATTTPGAVLFNACAPELWRRFTITLRRTLARQAGLTGKALAAQVRRLLRQGRRIPAARRGPLPRHHPARRPRRASRRPAHLGHPRLLTAAIDQAARAVSVTTPAAPGSRPARWPGAASSTSGRSPPAAT